MVELIVGRWYELYGIERWLFKLSSDKNTKGLTSCKHCIPRIGSKSTSKAFFNTTDKNKIKFADMEEVYKFFPEERPIENIYELW